MLPLHCRCTHPPPNSPPFLLMPEVTSQAGSLMTSHLPMALYTEHPLLSQSATNWSTCIHVILCLLHWWGPQVPKVRMGSILCTVCCAMATLNNYTCTWTQATEDHTYLSCNSWRHEITHVLQHLLHLSLERTGHIVSPLRSQGYPNYVYQYKHLGQLCFQKGFQEDPQSRVLKK